MFDPKAAKDLIVAHLDMVTQMKIDEVAPKDVEENYQSRQFCVLAGRDRKGCPLIWIRFSRIVPTEIKIPVGVKSTWLSLDAGLQDCVSIRRGVRLVYDMSGLGLKNLVANPLLMLSFKDAVVAVASRHPSRIAGVLFVDAPWAFKRLWGVATKGISGQGEDSVLVPGWLAERVHFCEDHAELVRDWVPASQLPGYLGTLREMWRKKEKEAAEAVGLGEDPEWEKFDPNTYKDNFYQWLVDRISGDTILY